MGVTAAINGLNADVYINIIYSEGTLAQLSVVMNKASGCPRILELHDTIPAYFINYGELICPVTYAETQ